MALLFRVLTVLHRNGFFTGTVVSVSLVIIAGTILISRIEQDRFIPQNQQETCEDLTCDLMRLWTFTRDW